jgi:hypothetical protein
VTRTSQRCQAEINGRILDFAAEVDRALRAPYEAAVEKATSTTFNPIESVKETADLLFNVLTGRNFKGTQSPTIVPYLI